MKQKNIFNKTFKSFLLFSWWWWGWICKANLLCHSHQHTHTYAHTHALTLTAENISRTLCHFLNFWCCSLYSTKLLDWHADNFLATLNRVCFCVCERECAASVEVWVSVGRGGGNLILFFNLVINLTAWQMDTISCLPPYDTNMPYYTLLCGILLGEKRH